MENRIAGRNRSHYAEVVRLLGEVCELYANLGEDEAWAAYIDDLRSRYKSLRGLKEELAAAGI